MTTGDTKSRKCPDCPNHNYIFPHGRSGDCKCTHQEIHTDQLPPDSREYTPETMKPQSEIRKAVGELDIHYGWVSMTPKVIGRGVTHLVNGDLDRMLALIEAEVTRRVEPWEAYTGELLQYQEKMRRTLIINRSDSKCGNCRLSAAPDEKQHNTKLGWGDTNGEPGCHMGWMYVTSEYAGDDIKKAVLKMRPDFQWLIAPPYPALAQLTQEKKG